MDFFDSFVQILLSFGLAGVFVLSIVDSTVFFFTPFAIDFLYIVLVSQHPMHMPYYALLVAGGSVLGCALTYVVISKAGEKTIEKHFSQKKLQRFRNILEEKGFIAISISALLPPPLPFSPVVAAAAVAKMDFRKLLGAVAIGRVVRFLVEGTLAILFGGQIMQLLESRAFQVVVVTVFLFALVGTAVTIYRWCRKPGPGGTKNCGAEAPSS